MKKTAASTFVADGTSRVRLAAGAPRARGFTLMELTIVVGCMAILGTVVFVGRGFINDANEDQTVATVLNLHTAANMWVTRFNYGRGYAGGGLPEVINLESMCQNGVILPPGALKPDVTNTTYVKTAWNNPIRVGPADAGTSAGSLIRQVKIDFCTPSPVFAAHLVEKLLHTKRFDQVLVGPCDGAASGVIVIGK